MLVLRMGIMMKRDFEERMPKLLADLGIQMQKSKDLEKEIVKELRGLGYEL